MASDIIVEDFPQFSRRIGDLVYEGSNNTIIILGRDRANNGPASKTDGILEEGAGSIHIIAGRKDKQGNPNFSSDDAFVYLSMKTNPDKNLGITSIEKEQKKIPAAIVKSDAVRIVYKTDFKLTDGERYVVMDGEKVIVVVGKSKLVMNGEKIVIDAPVIELGEGAKRSEGVILGETFMNAVFNNHTHQTAVGPSSTPLPTMSTDHISSKTVVR